jgi:hypothetical protein
MTVFGIENVEDLIAAINDNKILFEDNLPDYIKYYGVAKCYKFDEHHDKKMSIINSMHNLIRIGESRLNILNYIDKFLNTALKDETSKVSITEIYFKNINNIIYNIFGISNKFLYYNKNNIEVNLENGDVKKIDSAIAIQKKISDIQKDIQSLSEYLNNNDFNNILKAINDILTETGYSSIDEFASYYEKFLKLKDNEGIKNLIINYSDYYFYNNENNDILSLAFNKSINKYLEDIIIEIKSFSANFTYYLNNSDNDFKFYINKIIQSINYLKNENGEYENTCKVSIFTLCSKKNIDLFEKYYNQIDNNNNNNNDDPKIESLLDEHKKDNWAKYVYVYNLIERKTTNLENLIKNIESNPEYIDKYKKHLSINVYLIESCIKNYFYKNKDKITISEFVKNVKINAINKFKIEEYYSKLKESEERLKQYIPEKKIDELDSDFIKFNNIEEFKKYFIYENDDFNQIVIDGITEYICKHIIEDFQNTAQDYDENFDIFFEKKVNDILSENNYLDFVLDKYRVINAHIHRMFIDYCNSYLRKITSDNLHKIEYNNLTLDVTDKSLKGVNIRDYLSKDQIIRLCIMSRGYYSEDAPGKTRAIENAHSFNEVIKKIDKIINKFMNLFKSYYYYSSFSNDFVTNLKKILIKQAQDEESFLRKRSNSMGIIDNLKFNNINIINKPIIADEKPIYSLTSDKTDGDLLNQFESFINQFEKNSKYIRCYFKFFPDEEYSFRNLNTSVNDIKNNIIKILNFINSNSIYKNLHDNVDDNILLFLNERFKEKDFGTKKEKIERFTQIAQLLHNFNSKHYDYILKNSKYLEKSYLKNIFDLHNVIGNAYHVSINDGVNFIKKLKEITSKDKKAIPQKYLTEDMLYCISSLNNIKNSNDVDLIIEKILSNNPSESVKKFKYILENILNYEAVKKWTEVAQPKSEEVFSPGFSTDTFRFRVLGDLDPYHFSVGVDTNSCQAIGGAGESAAVDSFINPNAGVVVLEAKYDGVWSLTAQSYFHFVEIKEGDIIKKAIILDNIEAGKLIDKYDKGTFYPNAYAVLGNYLRQEGFDIVGCGTKFTTVLGPNEGHNLFNTIEIEKDPRHFEVEKHNIIRYTDVRVSNSMVMLDLLRPKFEIEMPKNITKIEPDIEKESFKLLSVYLRKFGNNKGLNLQYLSSILNSFGFKKESINVNRLIYKTI